MSRDEGNDETVVMRQTKAPSPPRAGERAGERWHGEH